MEKTVMGTTVAPEKILKELAALWVEEGKHGDAGVLRACSMTLVVLAEESEDAAALSETIASLMPQHPARAILVRLKGAGERALSEHVYQQCWRPFANRQQICCEQIEITASDAALGDLPPVILPLVVTDLPMIVWCRSPRLSQMPEFHEITRTATKVVFDSSSFPDPVQAIQQIAGMQARGMRLGDLAWTRLTRWREMIARVFENREYSAHLPSITQVNVTFGPRSRTAAWYLAAWSRNALAEAGIDAKLSLSPAAEPLGIELIGANFRVALACEGGTLAITVNDLVNRTNLGHATDYLLMREELSIVRRDTIFERALSDAAKLAVSSS
jgi:glucose-6-phosphate dehydrogenase assembly protein OpcA